MKYVNAENSYHLFHSQTTIDNVLEMCWLMSALRTHLYAYTRRKLFHNISLTINNFTWSSAIFESQELIFTGVK